MLSAANSPFPLTIPEASVPSPAQTILPARTSGVRKLHGYQQVQPGAIAVGPVRRFEILVFACRSQGASADVSIASSQGKPPCKQTLLGFARAPVEIKDGWVLYNNLRFPLFAVGRRRSASECHRRRQLRSIRCIFDNRLGLPFNLPVGAMLPMPANLSAKSRRTAMGYGWNWRS